MLSKNLYSAFAVLWLMACSTQAAQNQCFKVDSIEYLVKQDILAYQIAPNDPEKVLSLSQSLEAIGEAEQALKLAEHLLKLSPHSGSAIVAKIHALHRLGATNKALILAQQAYANKQQQFQFPKRLKSWLRHSILAMLLSENRFNEVEKMILTQFPQANDLIKQPKVENKLPLGVPIHTLAALIYAYRETGRPMQADGLAKHLKGFSAKGFFGKDFTELSAPQQWMLGSIWVVNFETSAQVPQALRSAFEGGFWQGWRFNYPFHPVYWPLRNDLAFQDLVKDIEKSMQSAHSCLNKQLEHIEKGKTVEF